jgi:predicted GNAT family acetyltransferase
VRRTHAERDPDRTRLHAARRPGHGYATSLVAAVSREQLSRGRTSCFLHTDLANPTSNAIYRRIGYERVCDSTVVAFDAV